MSDILVSVVIPAFNAENSIAECLAAVIKQSFPAYEIIVVNDGSTDNTLQILTSMERQFSNVNLKVLTQNNKGQSAARNLGIKAATGNIIAFVDADDIWDVDKLKLQVFHFKNSQIKFIGCLMSNGKSKHHKDRNLSVISFKKLLFKNFFSTPTVLLHKDIFKEIGYFDENVRYCEDYRLWLLIAKKYKLYLINTVMVHNYEHKPFYGHSGLSAKLWEMEKGEINNYVYLYKQKFLNFFWVSIAVIFSLFKYGRRYLIIKFK
jgi:glycosyltransferase involved in cell wall biosynthesis